RRYCLHCYRGRGSATPPGRRCRSFGSNGLAPEKALQQHPTLHFEEFAIVIRDGTQRASVHRPEVTKKQRVESDELGVHVSEDTLLYALTNDLLKYVRDRRKRGHNDFAPLWRKYIEFPIE